MRIYDEILIAALLTLLCSVAAGEVGKVTAAQDPPDRMLLWGDTHLHTNQSFDAFLNGNVSVTPDMAYRYARGEPIVAAYNRTRVQINTPLDFLVVTDHAEFLGGLRDVYYDGIQGKDVGLIDRIVYWFFEREIRTAIDAGEGANLFTDQLPISADPRVAAAANELANNMPPGADTSARRAWRELAGAASKHNVPGSFTAFIGWEWSSVPGGANLHRVVLSNAGMEGAAKFMPYSSVDSPYPEDLWDWLAKTSSESGVRFLAIPHNSNVSKGVMFDTRTLAGDAIDARYATKRMRWEPIVEVTQIKGDSETHEQFSPEDEFAAFEPYPFYLQGNHEPYQPAAGEYVRGALRTGLELAADVGVNPFQFGMIGSTDSHTGLSSAEEPNFWGKFATDSIPTNKADGALVNATGWTMAAAGLAAVWAEENTRDAIMDAMQRREVYATTGPRIRVRMFGGWQLADDHLTDIVNAGYSMGVPMGSGMPLRSAGKDVPHFLVAAERDPVTANLDRIQIIKGWRDHEGNTYEKIFNVAWSEGRSLDTNGRLPSVGDTVDRKTGQVSDHIGAKVLTAHWQDPEFDPSYFAFYYVRVLQVPTARHSLLDRLALGQPRHDAYPDIIQERAYTSPIWYEPPP